MSFPRARAFWTLPVTLALLAAPTSAAHAEMPRDAAAFRDSVGVNTHVSYYDTVYGKWSTVLDRLQALGVTHLRDGLFGNPTWRDWNRRYNTGVQAAAARGMRFTMVMGHPGSGGGTIDNLVAAAAGPAAGAVEAFEGPNEYDISGDPNWASALRAYQQELYTKLKANPTTRSLPVLGPSLVYAGSRTTLGNLEASLDQGNLHPYTGGKSPSAAHMASEATLASKVSGSKPLVATEFGFHNAMAANASQPPVSESVAAVYAVRTYLEHFRAGVKRTFAYELIDLRADPARTNAEHNWGLLRNDWTEKPAYVALKKLLATVGNPAPLSVAHDLPLTLSGDTTGVNRLLLERADGTYLLALWQNASLWDTKARQPLTVPAKTVQVDLGGSTTAKIHRPADSSTPTELAFAGGPTAVTVPADPVILEFAAPKTVVDLSPKGSLTPAPVDSVVGSIEGEAMAVPSTHGGVRSDATASGGKVLAIWANASASKQLTLTGGAVKLTVRARGTSCNGAPTMRVTVDGTQVGLWTVPSATLADHDATIAVPAGAHTVRVTFLNDYYGGSNCDRNVYVDKVVLRGA